MAKAKAGTTKAKPERKADAAKDKLDKLVEKLGVEAKRRVDLRSGIEDRWLQDIRQRYGEYEPKLKADLEQRNLSALFINETGPKTDACAARLFDMLFPTDDRNWGITPTPVPTLSAVVADALTLEREAPQRVNAVLNSQGEEAAAAMASEINAKAEDADKANAELIAAEKAAEAMQTEIDDQLKECDYAGECREVIDDMAMVGAGVMEGPVANDRVRRVWKTRPVLGDDGQPLVENGQPVVEDYLAEVTDPRPAARRVDYWGFFPQPDALKIEESPDFFVRRLRNEQQMRRMAREPGFDKDAIRELLKDGPDKGSMPSYISELRDIGESGTDTSDNRFVVWEYRGQLTADDLMDVCTCLMARAGDDEGRKRKLQVLMDDAGEVDLLDEINVVIWFCQGKLLKFGIHHLDRGEPIYSIVRLTKDPASIWGFGIPSLMRDPQSALAAAWRMMMDNGGRSSGPMVAINRKYMTPVDGTDEMYPWKVYDIKPDTPAGVKLFEKLDIASNQGDYAAIIDIASNFIDSMSGQPMIAQGEQPKKVETLGGMAMLMNAANVLIRRIVRNYDDDLTTPMIRRFYDWNMQFNKKRSIKGDFEVNALGSSVLLQRELQGQNMMAFAMNFAGHPVFGKYIKDFDTIKQVVKTHMIPANQVLVTDAEAKKIEDAEANAPTPKDPETVKAENAMALEDRKHAHRMEELAIEENIAMVKLATEQEVKLEDIRAWAEDREKERAAKARLFTAEVAIESQNAGGPGSGGYVSAPPARPKQDNADKAAA